ncbi:MAG TPA: hypothetical protein VIP70_00980, partial [Nitrososphaeraceae archaeon]
MFEGCQKSRKDYNHCNLEKNYRKHTKQKEWIPQSKCTKVRREVKPYCLQKFEDKEKTSKHIDDAHL